MGSEQNEWKSSERDDIKRITMFWQDIGQEFDENHMVIVATYSPDNFVVSRSSNFHQFVLNEHDNDGTIFYNGQRMRLNAAEKNYKKL